MLAVALGETDDVVVQYPVAPGSMLDSALVGGTQLGDDTGFHLLAIRRGGRYLYRPRGPVRLEAGDELIAIGPDEGRVRLAQLGGYELFEDDDTGEIELVPAHDSPSRSA